MIVYIVVDEAGEHIEGVWDHYHYGDAIEAFTKMVEDDVDCCMYKTILNIAGAAASNHIDYVHPNWLMVKGAPEPIKERGQILAYLQQLKASVTDLPAATTRH